MGEEHRLTAFENKVLKKKLESKRDQATRKWRRLHKEELYDLYSSTNIRISNQNNEKGGKCGTYGGEESCIQDTDGES